MTEMGSRSLRLCGSGGPFLAALLTAVLLACCSPNARTDPEAASARATPATPAPAPVLAEAKAEWPGLIVQVVEVKRNAGTVSVQLLFANTSQQPFEFGDRFASDPADRDTLADVVLVEPSGLRKYFVLRDRANRPAGSGAVSPLRPGERRPLVVRFPAPPAGTSRITIQIPHVPAIRDVPIS